MVFFLCFLFLGKKKNKVGERGIHVLYIKTYYKTKVIKNNNLIVALEQTIKQWNE